MKKLLVAAAFVLIALAAPRPASAHSSFFLSFGFPGFAFLFAPPAPPPVVYYPAPTHYYITPPVVTPYCGRHDRGRHLGWYKHGRGHY